MSQIFLDPSDHLAPAQTGAVDANVPPRIRRFGRIPDVSTLHPADLVLFSALKPKAGSKIIQRAQEAGGYAPDHATWHHAAVYLGDGLILEALIGGVTYRQLYVYSETHRMRFRRDVNLTPQERYRIAIHSMKRLRERYSILKLPRVWLNLTRATVRPASTIRGTRATICSQLYADAYMETTNRNVCRLGHFTDVPPAELSASSVLSDVHVPWIRVP